MFSKMSRSGDGAARSQDCPEAFRAAATVVGVALAAGVLQCRRGVKRSRSVPPLATRAVVGN
jgi:hypothetical protein